ncbi:MAG TPA: N-acetyltransferase family protein [Xanthobacteraceae bacterium]|nr:N-acetyltransferase family protein [Xanthobacteraceae bacterium]
MMMKATIEVRPATEADLRAIFLIYADAVQHSTAIWNETVGSLEDRRAWFLERTGKGFPVLVAEADGVLGYGSFGDFRPFEGYRVSVEHSVYVDKGSRGNGAGGMLMEALMEAARRMGKRNMIGAIDGSNAPSLALHKKFGFVEAGRLPGVGEKFGKALDLVLMQKVL